MHCRNCSNEVKENAVACLNCGLPPLEESKFCQDCGAETNNKQVLCVKCGCSLGNKKSNTNHSQYEGIYCSSDDKIVFGFCGGLAHKFGLQTSVVRFVTFLCLFFFIGWLYFLGIFLPKYKTKN